MRSSTSAIEPRITGPTIGTTPRMRFQTEPSVSRPRARCAAVIWLARSTIAGTVWTEAIATNAIRGLTPRRSRSITRADGRVVR